MMSNFNPPTRTCNKCGDTIKSSYPGEFVSCKCGAISVDQTEHYSRYIGDPQDFKHITDEQNSTD